LCEFRKVRCEIESLIHLDDVDARCFGKFQTPSCMECVVANVPSQ
jgi:hypothetical protein